MSFDESVDSPSCVGDLPFVATDYEGGIVCYWRVSATGDWSKDCASGRRYARSLVEVMERTGQTFLLQWVIKDMDLKERMTGLEVGFLQSLADLSIRGISAA